MDKELTPEHMAQVRGIVEAICEDTFPEINMEFVKNASDYTIKKMWRIIMGSGWESNSIKLNDLKRIVGR